MAEDGRLHIVMFPWLAFGHIIPYLELAKLIAQKGHQISFVSTPRNIQRLPKLPPNLAPLINLVKLPLPHVDNLPENAEATIEVPYNKVRYLKVAYDRLQQPMAHFLETSSPSPDWILHDFAPYWLGPLTAKLNIGSSFFSIFIAACLGYFLPPTVFVDDRRKPEDFTVKPKWVPFESTVGIRLFEVQRMFSQLTDDGENVSDIYRFQAAIKGCDVVAIRSCAEFEPEWLQLLEEIYQKPVIPVGHLPTTAYDGGDDDDSNETWRGMKEWLDNKDKGTVVYVAFGSETKPSQDELTEIALGLELSELPFFWALRKQRGWADTELIELPKGFEERTKGRGVVYTSWAPQLKILSHDSVGGFLNHSGWSSTVEAIQFGKALILLPFLGDQGLIASFLQEKKMAYLIPRDDRDGKFTRDTVAESLRLVMVEQVGKLYRDKVKEMSVLFGDKDRQDRHVDNLLAYLQTHRRLKSEK